MAKLIKLSDDVFNGIHPNGINEGYTKEMKGTAPIPVVGECYIFGNGFNLLRTSIVTAILSQTSSNIVFKTLNSTYNIEN